MNTYLHFVGCVSQQLSSAGLNDLQLVGRQQAGNVRHKPSSRLPLLSVRPTVAIQATENNQFIPLREHRHMCKQLAHDSCITVERPAIKLTTSTLLV